MDVSFTSNKNWMNGREMFRQTSEKQANAQTQVMQPIKQMVKGAGRRSLPKALSLSSNGNHVKDKVD